MNFSIKHIISLSLALIILISAIGISFNKMVCLSSGKVKYSLLKVKDCCDGMDEQQNDAEEEISSECCSFSSYKIQLETNSLTSPVLVKLASFVVSWVFVVKYYNLFSFDSCKSVSFIDLPPPCSGLEMLRFLSVFRV